MTRRFLGIAVITGLALGVLGFVLRSIDGRTGCTAAALIAAGALSGVVYALTLNRAGAFGSRRWLGWTVLAVVTLAAGTYVADVVECVLRGR